MLMCVEAPRPPHEPGASRAPLLPGRCMRSSSGGDPGAEAWTTARGRVAAWSSGGGVPAGDSWVFVYLCPHIALPSPACQARGLARPQE